MVGERSGVPLGREDSNLLRVASKSRASKTLTARLDSVAAYCHRINDSGH